MTYMPEFEYNIDTLKASIINYYCNHEEDYPMVLAQINKIKNETNIDLIINEAIKLGIEIEEYIIVPDVRKK